MGELREYLQVELPKYEDPIIYITSDFIQGCPKCNSSTAVYYIKLTERTSIEMDSTTVKADHHKFPIDVWVKYSLQKGEPQKIVIGTKRSKGKLQMILRQIS